MTSIDQLIKEEKPIYELRKVLREEPSTLFERKNIMRQIRVARTEKRSKEKFIGFE